MEYELEIERWRIPVQASGTSNSRRALEEAGRDLAELVGEGKEVMGCLMKVGRLMDYTGFLVRLTQAPGIMGSLDIRWWKMGRDRPVLVRWIQTKSGEAKTKRILRVRMDMVRRVAVPEMRGLLWELIGVYKELSELWEKLSVVLRGGRLVKNYVKRGKFEERIGVIAERLVELHGEVELVLLNRGVRVEKRFRVEEVVGLVG